MFNGLGFGQILLLLDEVLSHNVATSIPTKYQPLDPIDSVVTVCECILTFNMRPEPSWVDPKDVVCGSTAPQNISMSEVMAMVM